MNCSWCHKAIDDIIANKMPSVGVCHIECGRLVRNAEWAKYRLDEYERQYREKDPNGDPFSNELVQACLAEYRRLNALAMSKLTSADKFEVMFKGIQ